jgi:Domain of unknown function (DUF4351)
MTRTPYDQFAKHCFEPLLSLIGEFTPAKPVSAEVREIDVYFEPSPSASPPAELGLLSRCIPRPTLFEPFRNAASPHEIRACASKLYEVHNDIMRKAKRAKERPLDPEQRPFLWIITPTLSTAVQNGFGAVQDVDWPPGVLFAPKDWYTGFIVVHQLPKTPDTLWFRLFGTGNFQAQAFSELAQLPLDHPYRNSLMDSLANLKVILEERSSRTPEEQDLFMQLSPLYLEKIAAAEQRGRLQERREMVNLFLTERFSPVPSELIARLEALNVEQLQSLATSLFQFASIDDLADWLDAVPHSPHSTQ